LAHDVGDDGVENEFVDAFEVGLAARQQIRSRLAEDELHALGDHESGRKRKAEPHPARVQLPKLPPPDERLGGSSTSSWTRNEDHAYKEDDEAGRNEGYDDKEPCWDHLMVLHGVRDVEVDGREGAVVWEDVLQAAADASDYAEACQSVMSGMGLKLSRQGDASREYRATSGAFARVAGISYMMHIQSNT
jgi:hypothetical protein